MTYSSRSCSQGRGSLLLQVNDADGRGQDDRRGENCITRHHQRNLIATQRRRGKLSKHPRATHDRFRQRRRRTEMEGDEKQKPSTHLRKDVRLNREDVHLHLGGAEKCGWKLGELRLALLLAAEPVLCHSSFTSSLGRCSFSGSCSTSRSNPALNHSPKRKETTAGRPAAVQPGGTLPRLNGCYL